MSPHRHAAPRRQIAPLLFFVVILTGGGSAWAHPHMWIDASVQPEFDDTGLSGIRVEFLFDEFNSAPMIIDYDVDGSGVLGWSEISSIRETGFAHLHDIGYFMIAFLGSEAIEIPRLAGFHARIADGRLSYRFFLPIRVRWQALEDFTIAAFDSSYYVDFSTTIAERRFDRGSASVLATSERLRLATEGWGTIEVPAIRLDAL